MKTRWIVLCFLISPLLAAAQGTQTVTLLGDKDGVAFDPPKPEYIAFTVNELLRACTVATKIDAIPAVTYKGVRVVNPDGKLIEAHIFPDSDRNYMVKIYTNENGALKLHGKYGNHAYQLISMLEHPARPPDFWPRPVCWKEPRIYHPGSALADFERMAKQALKLERVTGAIPKSATLSPNGAYAFHRSEQAQKAPPGATHVRLLVFTEKPELLRLDVSGVQNLGDAKWLNEKLIYLRVWLGRLGGVDVILDVERDRFVLLEPMADGRLAWEQMRVDCKANPDFPECKAVCR